MKKANQKHLCHKTEAGEIAWEPLTQHAWEPLFQEPACEENEFPYMAHRLSDYRRCTRCGAIGMDEGATVERTLLLGHGHAERKRQQARLWNQQQTICNKNAQ